jgi:hypothetical protein
MRTPLFVSVRVKHAPTIRTIHKVGFVQTTHA